jgi:hypothetical protein
MEDEFAKHVLLLKERFFSLMIRNDMQCLAFQVAEAVISLILIKRNEWLGIMVLWVNLATS